MAQSSVVVKSMSVDMNPPKPGEAGAVIVLVKDGVELAIPIPLRMGQEAAGGHEQIIQFLRDATEAVEAAIAKAAYDFST